MAQKVVVTFKSNKDLPDPKPEFWIGSMDYMMMVGWIMETDGERIRFTHSCSFTAYVLAAEDEIEAHGLIDVINHVC